MDNATDPQKLVRALLLFSANGLISKSTLIRHLGFTNSQFDSSIKASANILKGSFGLELVECPSAALYNLKLETLKQKKQAIKKRDTCSGKYILRRIAEEEGREDVNRGVLVVALCFIKLSGGHATEEELSSAFRKLEINLSILDQFKKQGYINTINDQELNETIYSMGERALAEFSELHSYIGEMIGDFLNNI